MATLYDVPADEFIDELAQRLEEHVDEPEWAAFAKSGVDRELPPEQDDFWHRRAASVFRTIAIDGPVGVERLATRYGGAKDGSNRYQVAPSQRSDGSRNLIRTILQELEDAGFVEQHPGDQGRIASDAGRGFLDETAGDVLEALDRPELERYA